MTSREQERGDDEGATHAGSSCNEAGTLGYSRWLGKVAVLGIHSEPERAAFYVPDYLHDEGYRVIGVNPRFVAVDIVDVFRRGEQVINHVDDILAMQPRPKVVWMQVGVKSEDAAKRLQAEGIEVIQNRCTLADHQRLGLGKPKRG